MTLVEFLTARLDEDEAVLRAFFEDHHAVGCDDHEVWEPHPGGDCPSGWQTSGGWEHNQLSGPSSNFIRHMSPERLLREVEAKRAIVALAEEASALDAQVDSEFRIGRRDTDEEPYVGDAILRHLAAVYADHPDHLPEWVHDESAPQPEG